jgi:hypothetical protein
MLMFGHAALGITPAFLLVLGLGLFGSSLRALVTYGPRGFWQRQTLVDTAVGGVVAIVIPYLPYLREWTPAAQALIALLACYVLADTIVNSLRRYAPTAVTAALDRVLHMPSSPAPSEPTSPGAS